MREINERASATYDDTSDTQSKIITQYNDILIVMHRSWTILFEMLYLIVAHRSWTISLEMPNSYCDTSRMLCVIVNIISFVMNTSFLNNLIWNEIRLYCDASFFRNLTWNFTSYDSASFSKKLFLYLTWNVISYCDTSFLNNLTWNIMLLWCENNYTMTLQ